jgi:hypothetical protein
MCGLFGKHQRVLSSCCSSQCGCSLQTTWFRLCLLTSYNAAALVLHTYAYDMGDLGNGICRLVDYIRVSPISYLI